MLPDSGHTQATSKPVATRCPVGGACASERSRNEGGKGGAGRGKKRTRVVMGTRTVPGSRRSRSRGLPACVGERRGGAEKTPPERVRGPSGRGGRKEG